MNDESFGGWLKRQLQRREWSQAKFARQGNFSPSSVSAWINNERVPDPGSCDLIADALGLDRDLVLAIAGHRPVEDDDSPLVREFIAKVRRVDWNVEGRAGMFDTIVGKWIDDDRKMREGT